MEKQVSDAEILIFTHRQRPLVPVKAIEEPFATSNQLQSNSETNVTIDIPSAKFSCNRRGNNWVHDVTKSFRSKLNFEVDFPRCVFAVPNSNELKAYTSFYVPKWLGFGPYHHFHQGFYATEKHKLEILKSFLHKDNADDELIQRLETFVIQSLIEFEPAIRACYDRYLDLDSPTLAWIMLIDSFYLLHHLGLHAEESSRNLAQDLFMLENQIPSCILYKIKKSFPEFHRVLIPELFHNFCKAHSPFELQERPLDFRRNCRSYHLLDHMYRLILNSDFLPEEEEEEEEVEEEKEAAEEEEFNAYLRSGEVLTSILSSVEIIAQIAGVSGLQKHIQFVKSLPWQQATGLFSKSDEETQVCVAKIEVPSVTQLHKVLKIKFKPKTYEGIQDLNPFDPKGPTLHLPVMSLDPDSEVILRNLLAYEAAVSSPGSMLILAEYVDFMCGIVNTTEDAKFLQENQIITGSLNAEHVTRLFNGLSKTSGSSNSNLQMAIDEVNKRYNSTVKVRFGKFVNRSFVMFWKFLAVFSTVLFIVLFTLQSFCNIYGCSSRWFHYKGSNDSSMFLPS